MATRETPGPQSWSSSPSLDIGHRRHTAHSIRQAAARWKKGRHWRGRELRKYLLAVIRGERGHWAGIFLVPTTTSDQQCGQTIGGCSTRLTDRIDTATNGQLPSWWHATQKAERAAPRRNVCPLASRCRRPAARHSCIVLQP